MVTLKNRTKRVVTVNLDHAIVCALQGSCGCTQSEHRGIDLDPATGETGIRLMDRLICDSVHLMPGEVSRSLPDSVTCLPQVEQAIRVGEIVSTDVESDES